MSEPTNEIDRLRQELYRTNIKLKNMTHKADVWRKKYDTLLAEKGRLLSRLSKLDQLTRLCVIIAQEVEDEN